MDKGKSIFHDFGRRPLWMDPEQKHSKVKHGLAWAIGLPTATVRSIP